ncbi:MAG TPA: TetR/AcrR family transcriptional regulator [Burkholderiales bacterium]|jgi:AcrR family transcriptional regulator|nr:TetR/AcrR family transcriptional regulator [Burkholderiales bacterium]
MHLPRPDRRWTRRKEARPAELLAAALDLFVERGYAATRLDDVAARAGVSKGTLYLYFSSKEELFKAVIRSGIVPLIERGERQLEEHKGRASDLLRQIMFGWWASVGDTKLGGIPKLMFSECRNFPEIGKFYYDEVITRSFRLVQGVLEQGIRSGEFREVDANYATRLLLAPMVYLLLWRHSFDICDSKHIDPERYLELHLDMTINGLTPRGRERRAASAPRVINMDNRRGRSR